MFFKCTNNKEKYIIFNTFISKSKLRVYRKMKREIGFEEYLEHVKEAPSRSFLKFHLGTYGLFEELGRHDGGGVTGVS